ncbi:MAG: TonB-dependent receptor [Bacteroidales bacterium]|nr:MAG: TonB-dependent receptor [Bacteroidales bacterium]
MNRKVNRANREVRFFHKWSNKGYSILNSLKVAVKICVVPITYSLVASPSVAVAQNDTASISKHLDLKEVVIESKVKAEAYSELTRVVNVVTQQEIQQISASSLQDVLEKLINVDIRQRGGQGVQADINFRGGSFDQVLVLLNGVNITDPQTGHHNLNIPIDLSSIQRIEVLQGPGARIYGPGAFSGAINIITKPDPENSIKIASKGGEYGLRGGSIQSSVKTKNSSELLSVSHNQGDGYIENTDFKNTNLFFHKIVTSRAGDFNFFAGYQLKSFGATTFYSPNYPNQFENTKTLVSSLGYEKKWNQHKLVVNGYLRKHWDRFELFRSNPAAWYVNHNYHLSTVTGSKISYQFLTQSSKTQVGVELRNENIISNKLGDTLSNPVKIEGSEGLYYIKGDNRFITSYFADQVFYFNRFSISGGFSYSYCSNFNGNWSYGIDVSYSLIDNVKIYSAVNRSFRNPTFTDLYYEGPSNIGNSALKPESAVTYEGGVKMDFKLLSGAVGYFHRVGKNIIDWIMLPTETRWTTKNFTSLNTDGVDFFLVSNLKGLIPMINSVSANYSRYWVEKQKGDFDSYYALDNIKHNLRFGLNHQIAGKLSASWNFAWQERAGEYKDVGNVVKSYNPHWLIDLKISWTTPKYAIYAEGSNIFDKGYIDTGNVMQPGRWISAGFCYKFNFE